MSLLVWSAGTDESPSLCAGTDESPSLSAGTDESPSLECWH